MKQVTIYEAVLKDELCTIKDRCHPGLGTGDVTATEREKKVDPEPRYFDALLTRPHRLRGMKQKGMQLERFKILLQ